MAAADSEKTSGQCRCCLKRGLHRKLTDACDIHGQTKVYRELFLDCFNLQMTTNTNLTDLICTGCICRLNDAIDFKTQVEDSEQQLLSQISLNNKNAAPNEQFLVEFSPPNTVFINEMKEMADIDDQFQVEHDIKLSEIPGLSDSSVTAKRNEKTLDMSGRANISGDLHTEELTLKVEPEEVKEEPDDNLEYEDDTPQYEDDIQPGTSSNELDSKEEIHPLTPSAAARGINREILEKSKNYESITRKRASARIQSKLSKVNSLDTLSIKDHSCNSCKFTTKDIKSFKLHLKAHLSSNRYICDTCSFIATTKERLIRHFKIHTKPYGCQLCDKKFSCLNRLLSHAVKHSGEKQQNKTFACKLRDNLTRHIKTTHTNDESYTCEYCDKTFKTKRTLEIHVTTHTGDQAYACKMCNKKFTHIHLLNKHALTHRDVKPYACEYCNKQFKYKNSYTIHIRTHTKEKPYTCTICDEAFSTKSILRRHGARHENNRPFVCEICGYKFKVKQGLTRHVDKHNGKQYACDTCGKMFNCLTGLNYHIRVHTGGRPFQCEICAKTFRSSGQLTEHIRIHTGEKPFACKTCDAKFASRTNLRTHVRKHTGEKPVGCTLCDEKFRTKSYLIAHLKKVHKSEKKIKQVQKSENTFVCKICSETFACKKDLFQHVISVHATNYPTDSCKTTKNKVKSSNKRVDIKFIVKSSKKRVDIK